MPLRRGEPTTPRSRPDGLPRLLPARTREPDGLREHLARHGFIPYRNAPLHLAADLRAAGLTGRGGAAFPVYRKLEAVAGAGGRAFVVANGAESEPAASKDASLLWLAPHLVLDGLQLAAEAVGAQQACLYVHNTRGEQFTAALRRALAERWSARIDRVPVQLTEAPARFLAGQETAIVNLLNGGLALPAFTPPRVFERGVGGAPTLVQNVETLAHVALIGRYGAGWFRQVGTHAEPGSMLSTIHHANGTVRIVEAAIGTPLRSLLEADLGTDGTDGPAQAILAGGYHGTWLAGVPRRRADPRQRRAEAGGRQHRGGRAGRAAGQPLRPRRDGPRRPLPRPGVGRPVRAVPERPAPYRGRAGHAGRAAAQPAGPRRHRALGRPGHRPGGVQPSGRLDALRAERPGRLRRGTAPPRAGRLLGLRPPAVPAVAAGHGGQ